MLVIFNFTYSVEVPLISHFLPSTRGTSSSLALFTHSLYFKGVIGKDWDYFKFNLDLKIHLVELGDNEYTFAVLVSIRSSYIHIGVSYTYTYILKSASRDPTISSPMLSIQMSIELTVV